jgi:hypothetical protein
MNKPSLVGRIIAGGIAVCLLLVTSSGAVPDRKPPVPAEPLEMPTIDLNSLKTDAGVAFGDWSIWRYDQGGESYFMIHQKTGLTVYLYWGSNGWVNYRTKAGAWHVLYPTGQPSPQDRRDLNVVPFLGKQPTVRVAPGKYTVKNWTVTVTDETMEFFTPNVMSRMSIRRSSGDFMHNDRTINGN